MNYITNLFALEVQVQLALQALAGIHMIPVLPQSSQLVILLQSAVHNVTYSVLLPLLSLHIIPTSSVAGDVTSLLELCSICASDLLDR